MPPQRRLQSRSIEANMNLAMSAIEQNQLSSNRAAAKQFDVSKNTLGRRRNGVPARQDCVPNSKNLTELEEQVIIKHALDVDSRGFQLNYDLLRGLADKLLADRGRRRVGVN